jgi:peptidoglycan/LPS O-acetylase OafA/YrhL
MATKAHFEVLDGLRGVAALLVLVFHISEILSKGVMADNWLPHGALAVDFFFALSGFVIAHAYDRRMAEGLGFGGFMLRRFLRLHPIVPLATLIGALAWVFAPFHQSPSGRWTVLDGGGDGAGLAALSHTGGPGGGYPFARRADMDAVSGIYRLGGLWAGAASPQPRVLAWLLIPAGGLLAWGAVAYGNLSVGWGWSHWWMAEARLAFPFIFGIAAAHSASIDAFADELWRIGHRDGGGVCRGRAGANRAGPMGCLNLPMSPCSSRSSS